MIRPAAFGFNPETAVSNEFSNLDGNSETVHEQALKEFDAAVGLLKLNGIDVFIWQEGKSQFRPDAIFPNNWMSTHPSGEICIYPMLNKNRQAEVDFSHRSIDTRKIWAFKNS